MWGYVVATSVKDRLKYSDFLHVWGKGRTWISERHNNLLIANEAGTHQVSNSFAVVSYLVITFQGYDAFEPELMEIALQRKTLNLGSLIFGADAWKRLSASAGLPVSTLEDNSPLSKHFKDIIPLKDRQSKYFSIIYTVELLIHLGTLDGVPPPTNLNPNAYDFLFHPPTVNRPLAVRHRKPICYRTKANSKERDAWSLYYQPESSELELVDKEQLKQRLLSHITQHSNIMTVGPFDFSGTARVVNGRSGPV
jgi:hypothetical protein